MARCAREQCTSRMLNRWHGFLCLKGDQKAFAEIAESLLSMALNERTSSYRMDVVLNDYLDGSMKRTGGKVQEASFITIKQIKRSKNGENSCTVQLTEQAGS